MKGMLAKMKEILKEKSKLVHIAIILLGTIFILLGAFHTTIWFDESYSVAIANNSFSEIWTIGGHDVHPVLYYWMLKMISIIAGGSNILLYRLFSSVAVILLGILGYTHIRKDFGEKPGILFSFLAFFLPINVVYSSEIRMYTWGMLLVTLMAIYAYRIIKQEGSIKNWILFAIFSLSSCYIHYYGLMAAGIINLCIFIYLIIQAKRMKKITIDLKRFIISAIIQVTLYIPWVLYLFLQLGQVSNGFWIGFKFPDTLIEMFIFQFSGNLEETLHINNIYVILFGLVICAYIIYLLFKAKRDKTKEERKKLLPAIWAIGIYLVVIIAAGIISLIINQAIIYARYFLIITGLFIFFLSMVMGYYGNKYMNIAICTLILIMSILINIDIIQYNYDPSNKEPIAYLKENIKEGDVLVYGNEGSGFVVAANFPENTQYFYDQKHWNVEEAYKAYGHNMKTVYDLDVLKDYKGRIWFINSSSYEIYEEASKEYDLELIDQKSFATVYQKYQYTFVLAEKK